MSSFIGCTGSRGRGGNYGGSNGGVYSYDYDDLDIKPTSSNTTPGGIGRHRCFFEIVFNSIFSIQYFIIYRLHR